MGVCGRHTHGVGWLVVLRQDNHTLPSKKGSGGGRSAPCWVNGGMALRGNSKRGEIFLETEKPSPPAPGSSRPGNPGEQRSGHSAVSGKSYHEAW